MMKKGAKVGVLCFMTAAFFAGPVFLSHVWSWEFAD